MEYLHTHTHINTYSWHNVSSIDAQTNRQWIFFVDMDCLQKCGLGLLRLVQQNGISCLSLIQIQLFNTLSSWSGCQQKIRFILYVKKRAHSKISIVNDGCPENLLNHRMWMECVWRMAHLLSFVYHMSMFSTWIVDKSFFFASSYVCIHVTTDDWGLTTHRIQILRFNNYVKRFDVFVVWVAISIHSKEWHCWATKQIRNSVYMSVSAKP